MLGCDIVHRRSVAVLCVMYNIRCNLMHHLYGDLPVPVRVARGAVVAHRYTYGPPRRRTAQHRRTFILFSVSLWNDLADPVFDSVGLAGLKSRANAFLLAKCCSLHFCLLPFSVSLCWLVLWGWGVLGLIKGKSFSPSLALPTSFNNNNNK